ncbi:uncharacterized protein LOC129952362 [Eupeodes corollae]|uniref:uncharacterized protein LOC129952362 n=1 Tax=Eupeodes corollae TaxID=290404 RepID=UPI00249260E2|nr:uncharacterized protein LOC129952362 [Eupeodes corollae]
MPNHHCKACQNEDNDDMVQCDTCDDWYHYVCVGVNDEIKDHDWNCINCRTPAPEKAQDSSLTGIGQFTPLTFDSMQHSNPPHNTSAAQSQSAAVSAPQGGSTTQSQSHGRQSAAVSTPRIQPSDSIDSRTTPTNTTCSKRRDLLLQQLEQERLLQAQRDKEYIQKKYALLKEFQHSGDDNKMFQQDSTVQQQTSDSTSLAMTKPNSLVNSQDTSGWNSTFYYKASDQPLMSTSQQHSGSAPTTTVNSRPYAEVSFGDRPATNQFNFSKSNETLIPNKQQLAARQLMSKEHITFSGRIEEWPRFISWFNSTTVSCGYTDSDNLRRLQHCLKDDAFKTVGVTLFTPQQVPTAMKSLQMLYGRPEAIIDSLIDQIRKEPAPRIEKLQSLIRFSLAVQNACAVMIGSGLNDHLSNPSLLRELTEKLPPQIRLNWGNYRRNLDSVSLLTFSEWLEDVAQSASEVAPLNNIRTMKSERLMQKSSLNVHQGSEVQQSTHSHPTQPQQARSTAAVQSQVTQPKKCPICDNDCKAIDKCQKFLNLSLNEKWNAINRFSICRTCLRRHGKNRCHLLKECGVDGCTYKHHRLLHKVRDTIVTNGSSRLNCYHKLDNCSILFRIVPVTLFNGKKKLDAFAFLDDGSSISLIDEELANQLGVTGELQPLCLKWTANTHRTEKNSRVIDLQISANSASKKYKISNLHTVKSLELPKQSVKAEELARQHSHLKGIPISTYTNAKPQILLGLDQWKLSIPLRSHEGKPNEPVASKTRLGWTVYGPCPYRQKTNEQMKQHDLSKNFLNFHSCDCYDLEDEKLSTQFKKFMAFDLEATTNKKILRSSDDEKAITIIKNNVSRRPDGNNFVVPLLWKGKLTQLPDSRPMAERRLIHLEKKLSNNPKLSENLNGQIEEYLRKQYARKLSKEELRKHSSPVWYLPIFPVVNHNKPDKVRLVWDAAAAVNGVSLNSMLLSGPDIVPSLLSVLLRFRERKVAICGDIKEMFHQVWIRDSDQHAQRFLWRNKDTKEVEEFVMQVMTFGSTCSPFCAQFAKNTNARIYIEEFPRAVKAIIENHYVDDYLDSVNTEHEAITLAQNVTFIHRQAGFEIRNFLSNSKKVLKNLGESSSNFEKKINSWHPLSHSEKILGMWWSPVSDTFSFAIKTNFLKTNISDESGWPTKRELLKVLMSVFDPLGLIANLLVLLKILLQEVWKSAIAWDEQIQPQHFDKWCKWTKLIPQIQAISIERPYTNKLIVDKELTVQMHVFVDASEAAYAAAVYLRFTDGKVVEVTLIAAKTKVAPLKIVSIPRLELEAAILGVRLAKTISENQTIEVNERYFWSDSKTVLNWIHSDHRKYKQFVAFRVGEILEETETKNWRWIPSKSNVADEATKWRCNLEFSSKSRWYKGVSFLYESPDEWPGEFRVTETTNEEIRHVNIHHVSSFEKIVDYTRFSTWERIFRVMGQVFRYARKLKSKVKSQYSPPCLTSVDLAKAENYLFRLCQAESFPEEISALKSSDKEPFKAEVVRTSSIYKLSPYLDENSTMRVKGRIDAAYGIPLNTKRPIILPNNHYITEIIISSYHYRFCHQNDETVINELRQKCLPQPPRMGDLPAARLQPFTRPFSFIGMDYFGPLFVTVGRRLEKRWGVLITCMTVRAIHIEVAHSLSTDSCIMALKRFIARRGWPLEIYSDNGTNFRGASNELREAMKRINVDELATNFVGPNLKWNFIPPSSPHMGGTWERLVRSVKRTLTFITPTRNPSDELLLTMLAEVERIINNRPLTYFPLDSPNEEALTPNHLLLGSSNGEKSFGTLTDDGVLLKKNWLTSGQYANRFWRRWVNEYLPDLTRRTKWFAVTKPLREGDVVIIADPNNPRNSWPKGIILQTIPGRDGEIRSAIVKTSTGVYTRPTAKLAVLDVGRFDDSGKPVPETALPGRSIVKSGNANNSKH